MIFASFYLNKNQARLIVHNTYTKNSSLSQEKDSEKRAKSFF